MRAKRRGPLAGVAPFFFSEDRSGRVAYSTVPLGMIMPFGTTSTPSRMTMPCG